MSTLEKLLVLGVLGLVSVILAISLFWSRDVDAGHELAGALSSGTQAPLSSGGAAAALPNVSPTPGLPGPPILGAAPREGGPGDELVLTAQGPKAGMASPTDAESQPSRALSAIAPNALVRPSASRDYWLYTVRPGDTPSGVSKRLTGTTSSARAIDLANDGRRFVPGESVLFPDKIVQASRTPAGLTAPTAPAPLSTDAPTPKAEKLPVEPAAVLYTVRNGETLRVIARKQLKDERRWKEIQKLNNLSSDVIRAGQKIKLPSS